MDNPQKWLMRLGVVVLEAVEFLLVKFGLVLNSNRLPVG